MKDIKIPIYIKKLHAELDEGIHKLSVQELLRICNKLSEFSPKKVQKVVYDKNFRPKGLTDQYELLKGLAEMDSLPLNVRFFALIAAGHKSMESLSEDFVLESIKGLEKLANNKSLIAKLGYQDLIREDFVHVTFSIYSVLFHQYIFMGQLSKLKPLIEEAKISFHSLNYDLLGKGYYQTCTNILRVLSLGVLLSLLDKKEKDNIDMQINDIKLVLMLGLQRADSNEIKFEEYSQAIVAYKHIKKLVVRLTNSSVDNKFILRSVSDALPFITRNHVEDKNVIIRRNFYRFCQNALDDNSKSEEVNF